MSKDHRVHTKPEQLLRARLDALQERHNRLVARLRSPTMPLYDPGFPLDAVDGQHALQTGNPYYFWNGEWRRFDKPRTLLAGFDGLGFELEPGDDRANGECTVHFDGVITAWSIVADRPGDLLLDIWKAPIAAYPPTLADTIIVGAGVQPTLAGSDHATSTDLTDWTTAITSGDSFKFNIDAAATIQRATLALQLQTT